MGSPGVWIKSTIAGEMRNSKFSAACRSRSISPTCSGPKRSASASSDVMLLLRSSSCQVSIRQILGKDHEIVTRRVVRRDGRGSGVAACFVKASRRSVIGARRGLHDHEPPAVSPQPMLHLSQELRTHAGVLALAVHDDPVEIASRLRARGRAPARVTDQVIAVERAEELIVLVAVEGLVQQLDRGRDLLLAEETGRPRQLLKPCAVRVPDG